MKLAESMIDTCLRSVTEAGDLLARIYVGNSQKAFWILLEDTFEYVGRLANKWVVGSFSGFKELKTGVCDILHLFWICSLATCEVLAFSEQIWIHNLQLLEIWICRHFGTSAGYCWWWYQPEKVLLSGWHEWFHIGWPSSDVDQWAWSWFVNGSPPISN